MLQPRLIFHGLESTGWLLFCLGAVVVALALIVVLLRYERRLVPRKVGFTLLTLRTLVLLTLLLTLMEPTLTWTLDREQTGRIVVALDLSESMDTADTHATRAEKLRWARALGLIGNTAIDARLTRWIRDYEAGREPELVDPDETADPDRRAQLTHIRREELDRIFQEVNAIPRKEIARRVLSDSPGALLPRLREVANVDLVVFAGKGESADEETLPSLVKSPPGSLIAEASDLTQALAPVAASADASPVIGVVLLTDGRDNAGRDPLAAAVRSGQLRMKICPIIFGSRNRPKDLAVAELDYPRKSLQGDKPVLKATLHTAGFEGQELTVVLEKAGGEPVTKTIAPRGPTAQLDFDLEGRELGRHEYTLRLEPREGETRDDNNSKAFALQVVDDKVRVLLLEGEARWEFRYIDNALARDDRVESSRVVFEQPYMGVLPDTFFPRRLDLPREDEDLAAARFDFPDLVIIGDIAPGDLPEHGWKLMETFVSEAGGTLVLVAGKQHNPLANPSAALHRLLPVQSLRPVDMNGFDQTGPPAERGFHLSLTPDGERTAMLQLDTDPAANRAIWQRLPGHMWGLLAEPKPGATVYAYATQPGAPAHVFPERQSAVIVQQHYGFGQVLWIGIDSTWRWRHRVGDAYHHRFWGQLGRWAADNKAAAGNDFVKFGPDRSDIEVGEDALLRARFTPEFLGGHPGLAARAELTRAGDDPARPFTTVRLEPVAGQPLLREGRAASLPAGVYTVKLVLDGAPLRPDEIVTTLYVQERHTVELSDLSSNRDLLAQMADASGGRLFDPNELHDLPAQFHDPEQTATLRHEEVLWDRWYTLAAFFTLLTSEWLVRKFNGLP